MDTMLLDNSVAKYGLHSGFQNFLDFLFHLLYAVSRNM
jgi:hypothetical protein